MRSTNIDFSGYRPQLLKRRVQHRLHVAGCDSYWEYVSLLNKYPSEYDRLIESLTIKESYFFRDKNVFELLKNEVIPEIICQKHVEESNVIRVWSCGMGHGQEAYSIAILLCEALGQWIDDYDIRILATDIDKDALEKAPWGSYTKRALRNMSPHLLYKYFTKVRDRYVVSDRVRILVDFHRHDIALGPVKQGMDLVLCRNLLIYFEKGLQEKAVRNLHSALNPGGFLILGKAETLPERVRDHFDIIDLAERVYRDNLTLSARA